MLVIVAANNAANAIFMVNPPGRQASRADSPTHFLNDTGSHVFCYRDLGEGGNADQTDVRDWAVAGHHCSVTGRPFLLYMGESKLCGGGSISLIGCKNVAKFITER